MTGPTITHKSKQIQTIPNTSKQFQIYLGTSTHASGSNNVFRGKASTKPRTNPKTYQQNQPTTTQSQETEATTTHPNQSEEETTDQKNSNHNALQAIPNTPKKQQPINTNWFEQPLEQHNKQTQVKQTSKLAPNFQTCSNNPGQLPLIQDNPNKSNQTWANPNKPEQSRIIQNKSKRS
jgi:hypothetical protein